MLFMPGRTIDLPALADLDRVRVVQVSPHGPPRHEGRELKVVCWNIERGTRPVELLQALQGPLAADLYLLQEVDWNTRRSGYRNVAETFARALEMNCVFGIEFQELAQGRPGAPAYHGQAVLTRLPILGARVLRFRHQSYDWGDRWWKPRWGWVQPRRGGRMALVVELEWAGYPLVIYNTHLESKGSEMGRVHQISEILADLAANYPQDVPVILAGDLNTKDGDTSPVLQALEQYGLQGAVGKHKEPRGSLGRHNPQIDWIFVRHLHGVEGGFLRLPYSDHDPLATTLRIRAPRLE